MVIAAFKLLKGLALLAVAFGALSLLHKDMAAEAEHWVNLLRIDPHNRYILWLLEKLSRVDAQKLKALSIGTFVYSGVFLTEGLGLALRKRWAEYMTILTTASFLPVEGFEIVRHATAAKVVLLVFNIGIVVYLVFELKRNPKHR
jgi:uncharacterized membrane protein (DUF2068 family)